MRNWALMAALPLAACSAAMGDDGGTPGTGSGTGRDFAISGFSAVQLAGSDDIEVKVGSGFSIRATGPSDQLDRLKIERNGDTLKIGRKPSTGFDWGTHRGVKITVTMPAIAGASVTGSGQMTVDRVTGAAFKASATGSGDLDIASLDVKDGAFSVTGSGGIKASGRAATLSMSVTGSGDIDAKGVMASGGDVTVLGSGSANATVNGAATVSIMGSGDVDLGPGAKCTTNKMGSGDVVCGH